MCRYLYPIYVIYSVPKVLIKLFILTGIIFMWKQRLFSKILASGMVAVNQRTSNISFFTPKLILVAKFSQDPEHPLCSGKQLNLEIMSSFSNFL